jgi:CRP-like cAMP-binding protein
MMSIVDGRVKISVTSPDGKEAVLAVLGPGEVLGEMAILEDKERSADATALEACELLVLLKRDFIPFLERNPAIAIRLLRILCERVRRTSALIEDRTFLSLPARLAKTLLDLADGSGRETDAGTRIDFKMSQKNFGALLGASRESVNKQLHAWQAEGLLTIGRGYVVLARADDLARVIDIG